MTVDEDPGVSRKRRSRKKRRSRRARRYRRAIIWSLVGLFITAIFITGVVYIVLSMRGEGSGTPPPNLLPP